MHMYTMPITCIVQIYNPARLPVIKSINWTKGKNKTLIYIHVWHLKFVQTDEKDSLNNKDKACMLDLEVQKIINTLAFINVLSCMCV